MDDKNILEQPVNNEEIIEEKVIEENIIEENDGNAEATTLENDHTEELVDESEYLSEDFVYSDDLEDLDKLYGEDETSKNSFSLDKSLIMAACIFLCAIIGFSGYMLFTKVFGNNFYGTWVLSSYATIDEATDDHTGNGVTYLTLNDDGSVVLTFGTMKIMGQWNYNTNDNTKVDIISYSLSGTFDVNVEGNLFVGRTMKISNEMGSLDFNSTTIPDMYVEKKDTKIDDNIIGEWSNTEYSRTYIFNKDGSCHLNTNDELLIDGAYSVDKDTVTVSYISDKVIDTPLKYEFADGKLTIEGVVFEKVK